MEFEEFKLAVLVPTYNGGEVWDEVLLSIDMQKAVISEKIIIDSGSKDNSVLSAKKHNFRVLSILASDFTHGLARQLLADDTKEANILIFLTQDCILADDNSISNLVKAFENPKVGIAYGRQLPRDKAKLLETHARIFNYPSVSKVKSLSDKSELGIKTASCSNSFAAYRKQALIDAEGFPEDSIFGEDVIVGGRMLIKGWEIAYVAEAESYHSHDYSIKEEFKRYFDIGVFHKTNDWLLKEFGTANGEGLKFIKSEFKAVVKNNALLLPKMFASTIAKFVGYKLGLKYKQLPGGLKRNFSMYAKK